MCKEFLSAHNNTVAGTNSYGNRKMTIYKTRKRESCKGGFLRCQTDRIKQSYPKRKAH